jgi:hypothetical protein
MQRRQECYSRYASGTHGDAWVLGWNIEPYKRERDNVPRVVKWNVCEERGCLLLGGVAYPPSPLSHPYMHLHMSILFLLEHFLFLFYRAQCSTVFTLIPLHTSWNIFSLSFIGLNVPPSSHSYLFTPLGTFSLSLL